MAAGHGGGWWAARGIQPPRAGRCQRCPSLSKEGTFLNASFTYVALYREKLRAPVSNLEAQILMPQRAKSLLFFRGAREPCRIVP